MSEFYLELKCGPSSQPVSLKEFTELVEISRRIGVGISVDIAGIRAFAREVDTAQSLFDEWIAAWERNLDYSVPVNSPAPKVRTWKK